MLDKFKQIKSSLQKVKYYDFFEKIIEEIIFELNNVYTKLRTNDSSNKTAQTSNIDQLKQNYTVKSQHKIHDTYINTNGDDVEFFDEQDEDARR